MASYYVKSGAAGAADGSSWINAYTTLAAALTARLAGDTFYISNNHAETQASLITLTSPGTAASPCTILCVDDSATPPTALAITATISTTGANAISGFGGFAYCYGIAFQSGSAGGTASITMSSATSKWWRFEACTFKLNNTSASSLIQIGATQTASITQSIEWINCTVNFGAATQDITSRGALFTWINGSFVHAGASPTVFDGTIGSQAATNLVRGINFDCNLTSFLISNLAAQSWRVEDCGFTSGSNETDPQGSYSTPGVGFEIVYQNCGSTSANYRYSYYTDQGSIFKDTTVYMLGGATDGTTPYSLKMRTNVGNTATFYSPLESEPILVWNDSLSSQTVIVNVIAESFGTHTNGNLWMEVEYLGTAGNPLGVFATTRKADIFAADVALTTDSTSTWIGSGTITSPVQYQMSITFTAQFKGYYRVKVIASDNGGDNIWFNPPIKIAIPSFVNS